MTETVATGIIMAPLGTLKTMLSNCSNFRTFVAAATPAAALASIHLSGISATSTGIARPHALLAIGEAFKCELHAGGARNYFINTGSLIMIFEANVATAQQGSLYEAEVVFMNRIGAIINDLQALSGSGVYLAISGIEMIGKFRSDPEDGEGDYMQAGFEISYDPR